MSDSKKERPTPQRVPDVLRIERKPKELLLFGLPLFSTGSKCFVKGRGETNDVLTDLQRIGIALVLFRHREVGVIRVIQAQRETNAALLRLDPDNAGFDFLTDLERVADVFNMIFADLGDVDETVDTPQCRLVELYCGCSLSEYHPIKTVFP